MIYEFYWSDGSALIEISAKSKEVEKILDEYRKQDEENYNIEYWMKFLNKRGIKASIIEPQFSIYF